MGGGAQANNQSYKAHRNGACCLRHRARFVHDLDRGGQGARVATLLLAFQTRRHGPPHVFGDAVRVGWRFIPPLSRSRCWLRTRGSRIDPSSVHGPSSPVKGRRSASCASHSRDVIRGTHQQALFNSITGPENGVARRDLTCPSFSRVRRDLEAQEVSQDFH